MTSAVPCLASLFQLGYSLMLLGVGFAGMWTASWELSTIFGLPAQSALPEHGATFLSQYRFLKSVEFGAGIFGLAWRQAILAGKPPVLLFLVIVGGGVLARAIAWMANGRPSWPFVTFLALEALTFVLIVLNLRRGRGGSP
jgi:hypothetical protein